MSSRQGKIAFVPARYGDRIVGGAEIVLRHMAFGLQKRGWDVEILTTTALDHHTWKNETEPGVTVEDGMPVRRFTVDGDALPERGVLEHRILTGDPLTISEQQRWMNSGMRAPDLYHYILDSSDEYRAFVFTPYPFWVTFACSQIVPHKSVLWTCLHDEPYAYLELFQPVFTGSAGLLFQSDPEQDLAERITSKLAPHKVVGCGVEVPASYDPDGFRERYGIEGRFLLYAGRREGAKGWDELLEILADIDARGQFPFTLVTMGGGEVRPPVGFEGKVIDVGFLDDDERDNAFAAADAYIQPSRFEAFSRTIMEAWLAGTPVIANGGSDVVKWHCERSGAGLTYDDALELEEALRFVAEAPEEAAALAVSGREYVLSHYQWETVLDAVEAQIEAWTGVDA